MQQQLFCGIQLFQIHQIRKGHIPFRLQHLPDIAGMVIQPVRTLRQGDIPARLLHNLHYAAQNIGGCMIAVLPERFHRRLDNAPVQIGFELITFTDIIYFGKNILRPFLEYLVGGQSRIRQHRQHGNHQPVQEKAPVMAGDLPVIQAVYKFVHQLGRFLPVSVIHRLRHGIFDHKIVPADNTVIAGNILIKSDIAVIRMLLPGIPQRFHTFIISGAQIFQPWEGLAYPGYYGTAEFLFKKCRQAAMYLTRPLLQLLLTVRTDHKKYLPVHAEYRCRQQRIYFLRYFLGRRYAQGLGFQLAFLVGFPLQHTHNGQQTVPSGLREAELLLEAAHRFRRHPSPDRPQ